MPSVLTIDFLIAALMMVLFVREARHTQRCWASWGKHERKQAIGTTLGYLGLVIMGASIWFLGDAGLEPGTPLFWAFWGGLGVVGVGIALDLYCSRQQGGGQQQPEAD